MTEEKHACCIMVCAPGTYGAFHQHRCRIKATAFREGNWYCTKHDPEVAKALSKKRDEKWAEKSRIEQAKFAAQVCIPDLLKAVKLVLALDGQPEVFPEFGTFIPWVVRLDPKAKEQLQNAVKKYEDMIKEK